MSSPPSAPSQGVPIALETLPIQQLSQIKKQLEEELQHLTLSFQSIRGAQVRFRECVRCIATGLGGNPNATPADSKETQAAPSSSEPASVAGTPILVPLTASLYVPGLLAGPAGGSKTGSVPTVLVDIGTGYYVDKTLPDALDFYHRKIADLEVNVATVEKLVKTKSENVRTVEEVLRQKLFAESTKAGSQTAKA